MAASHYLHVYIPEVRRLLLDSNYGTSYETIIRFRSIIHLKPTCYVMHYQSNIQQLYAVPTLYLCVL